MSPSRRLHRYRRLASLLLLSVGWMAIVATSQDPNNSSWAIMGFDVDDLEEGHAVLVVGLNDPAASYSTAREPLHVRVTMRFAGWAPPYEDPRASLIVPGHVLPFERSEAYQANERIVDWTPYRCLEACLRYARLVVEGIDARPATEWSVYADITYGGDDSVPENARIELGLLRQDTPEIVTSMLDNDSLLPIGFVLDPGRTTAHQRVRFEVQRDAIPGIGARETADLVWRGGSMSALGADDQTTGRLVLRPEGRDPLTVEITTLEPIEGVAYARFELPFTATCESDLCVADVVADFELTQGRWLVLEWSNTVQGLRTQAGNVWVRGWRLADVP